MNNLPREITEEVLLNINPEKIFVLCSINKLYNRICNRDSFWRRYYKRWVNSEYEIYPELKVDGRWREALLRNYSRIIHINFNTIRKNDMWIIEEINYEPPRKPDRNFYCIERKDNILKCVPILPLGLRMGINPSAMHMITSTMTLVDERLKIMGIYEYMSSDGEDIIDTEPETIGGMDILVYPFHHYIIIDIDEIPLLLKPSFPCCIYDTTLRTQKSHEKVSQMSKKGYSLSNGTWRFNEINPIVYPEDIYLKKIKGVKLVIPS